jgi:iron complex transport system ATP-binding protein
LKKTDRTPAAKNKASHNSSGAPPIIEMRRISVARAGQVVLHDLNLRIEAGEHVAIMGPNGSGKSTLIKTITRELYPLQQAGSHMSLFGQEGWDVSELRSLLGIVNNDLAPFHSRPITGRDAVLSGFFSSIGLWRHQKIKPEMREKTRELMAWLEISHIADRIVNEISSGELRRVMIARALVHDARALLLDEPSNSLDVSAQIELRQSLSKLAQSGIALLMITHHLPDVIPDIERVIFLREGRIVGDGPKRKLLTPASLGSLFGCPIQIVKQDGYYHLVS